MNRPSFVTTADYTRHPRRQSVHATQLPVRSLPPGGTQLRSDRARQLYMIRIQLLSVFAALSIPVTAFLQCSNQVLHTSGAQQIGCVHVIVERTQFADTFTTYCPATMPFFLGFDRSTAESGYGSYTFEFQPPVTGVTLNFSGLTGNATSAEVTSLYVNGTHYAIPEPGTPNGCDAMAILTADGDITGNGSVSGWSGTTITGSISTLEVRDSVIFGTPAGMLFSLFFCEPDYKIDIGEDTTVCAGDTLVLEASLPPLFWQDSSQGFFYEVTTPGTYWAASSFNGCLTKDSVAVTFAPCGNTVHILEMPNVFTPDGDGLNDMFVPAAEEGLTNARLTILNRWGSEVFEGELHGGWNGKSNGMPCTEGTYFYRVDYTIGDGSRHTAHGFAELVR